MKNRLTFLQIAVDCLIVPDEAERDDRSIVDDDILLKSIKTGGVQQPLVVVAEGQSYRIIKGTRRLACARTLGLPKVPCMVDVVPSGEEPAVYAQKMRFILDEHRQDLMPSQKGQLLMTLKQTHGFTSADLAAYLGVNVDSITNWLAVLKYIKPVVQAMDTGALTMLGARVFDGMSDEGQQAVWRKYGSDLCKPGAIQLHKKIRSTYSPSNRPEFYRNPELVKGRIARKGSKRKGVSRASLTADEKRKLLGSFEMKEIELSEAKADAKEMRSEIEACIPIVSAILQSDTLRAIVPPAMLTELERFGEVYC